jgi:hypothetical protein
VFASRHRVVEGRNKAHERVEKVGDCEGMKECHLEMGVSRRAGSQTKIKMIVGKCLFHRQLLHTGQTLRVVFALAISI